MSIQLTMLGQKVQTRDIPLFVKWAGGKKQLLKSISKHLPATIENYFEPFVGGGAVFFFIQKNFSPKKVILSDINEELINTYKVIRDESTELFNVLNNYKKSNSKEFFLKIRAMDIKKLSDVERAARFIYLNKTCFNGLYRVNSKGEFNVPYGSYSKPSIFDKSVINEASNLLKNVELRVSSYEDIIKNIKAGDFVYLDPPYYPLKKESFTTYTKNDFTIQDHAKLAEFYRELDKKQVKVLLSNSYTPDVLELYKGFNINTVFAKRAINCKGEGRGEIKEVLITNYPI